MRDILKLRKLGKLLYENTEIKESLCCSGESAEYALRLQAQSERRLSQNSIKILK